MVVAPYNAQVRLLRERLPAGVEVGTVDKFQGREAPVVFYSMACSSGEDVPRGLDFLLSRNRLNVASRARSASPTSSARRACSRSTAARSSTCGSRTRCASSRSWCLTRCENRRHDDSIGGGAVATSSRAWYEGPARARTASADSVMARAVRSATLGATWR